MSKQNRTTVPSGEYFLGDPCYVVRDDDWLPLLEDAGDFDEHPDGRTSEVAGVRVVAFNTAYGDGKYPENQTSMEYPVDSGLIGLVPMYYARREYNQHGEKYQGATLGRVVTFKDEVVCWNENGVLHFGDITIDTRGGEYWGEYEV